MSRFTAADHRFARAISVDLGEAAPPPTEDEVAERLVAKFESGEFDEECDEPTIRDWQEHSAQVEKESTQFYRNWMASERHREIVGNRNSRLIKILAASMLCTSISILLNIAQWLTH